MFLIPILFSFITTLHRDRQPTCLPSRLSSCHISSLILAARLSMAKKRTTTASSPCWYMPFTLAWIFLLIQMSSFVHGLAISSATDQKPRAAFVSLAHENDLSALLSSISQLEETFNHRYQYHWIFFSTQPLSEEFRQQTSNATGAVCFYEVISGDKLASPKQPAAFNTLSPAQTGEYVSEIGRQVQSLDQISRWNSGPFASENRLRDYDWIWRIEPGVSDAAPGLPPYMNDLSSSCL